MDQELSEIRKNEYVDEIKTFLTWVAGDGLNRMAMIYRMAIPSVQTDAQGLAEVRDNLKMIRTEGLTLDVGVPTIGLLIQAGQHLREYGAPIPSHDAITYLAAGRLGHGRESLLSQSD